MKICLSADWQFDSYTRLSTPLPNGITSRLGDMLAYWNRMGAYAVEAGASELIVAGDLFNNRTAIDLTVLDAVCRAVHESSGWFDHVRVLVGNHDAHLRTPTINSLQALRGLADVLEAPEVIGKIGYVPWNDDLTAFRKGIDAVSSNGAEILISHVLIEGSVPKGGIPLAYLQPDKFKRIFVGDVHDPITHPDCLHVQYIGGPMQLDWRDAGRTRGFILYDVDTDEMEYVENDFSPRFYAAEKVSDFIAFARKEDFIRVTADAESAPDVVVAAKKTGCKWVESTTAKVDTPEPRLAVSVADDHVDVLRKYARMKLPDVDDATIETLVQEGVSIIEEAKV